ncbi:hypothetical protein KHM83_12965 [Fusibacter paucivorans]|uniref:Uncharacterized protein n=1 Tax=Fusibacter paucivorans TaxID=76009 RepID=A0ABS5PQZ8_9FIRM|nr:hypothetical protein [Fusibacter paucivorans]MBS7527589.1 hypothetical protein [Fusibacter paucivorans]
MTEDKKVKTIGVKFCGGCNPKYDRKAVYHRLLHLYGEAHIRLADPKRHDAILCVICGCPSKCAAYRAYRYDRIVWIDSNEEAEGLLLKFGDAPE